MTVAKEQATANYVPAAAVIRRWQGKSEVKIRGSTPELLWKLFSWSTGEVSGIPSVAVKCVDIRRNTGGEGGQLGFN